MGDLRSVWGVCSHRLVFTEVYDGLHGTTPVSVGYNVPARQTGHPRVPGWTSIKCSFNPRDSPGTQTAPSTDTSPVGLT